MMNFAGVAGACRSVNRANNNSSRICDTSYKKETCIIAWAEGKIRVTRGEVSASGAPNAFFQSPDPPGAPDPFPGCARKQIQIVRIAQMYGISTIAGACLNS